MNDNTQQQTTTPTPEESGGKLFTQEQVNDIVRERLAHERKKLADSSEYKAKYESALAELNGMKAAQLHQKKESVYRALLAEAGISEKRINAVMRVSKAEIDTLELDEDGKIVGADKLLKVIKNEWADFIPVTRTEGAPVAHPPMHGNWFSDDEQIANAFKPKI